MGELREGKGKEQDDHAHLVHGGRGLEEPGRAGPAGDRQREPRERDDQEQQERAQVEAARRSGLTPRPQAHDEEVRRAEHHRDGREAEGVEHEPADSAIDREAGHWNRKEEGPVRALLLGLEVEPAPDQRERDREACERAAGEKEVGEPPRPRAPGDEALGGEVARGATQHLAEPSRVAHGQEQRPDVERRGPPAPEGAHPVDRGEASGHCSRQIAEQRRVETREPARARMDGGE